MPAPNLRCSICVPSPKLDHVLPAEALLTSAEETRPYESDGLTMYRELPAAVRFRKTKRSYCGACDLFTPRGVNVVARGAGTRPVRRRAASQAGVLSPGKFSRPSSPSTGSVHAGRTAWRAQSRDFQRRRAARTLYAPDPSSQMRARSAATSGENAGGVHCLKYGGRCTTSAACAAGSSPVRSSSRRRRPRQRGLRPAGARARFRGLLAVTTEITVNLTPSRRRRKLRSPLLPTSGAAVCRGRRRHRRRNRARGGSK